MKKRSLKKTLRCWFFSESERKFWKSSFYKTIYFLEVLENKFPEWTLPLDLEMVILEGSKIEHQIAYGNLKNALCETKMIESKEYPVNYTTGDGKKGSKLAEKYRITPEGLNLLNNVRMKELNIKMFWLTVIVSILGLIQILSPFIRKS